MIKHIMPVATAPETRPTMYPAAHKPGCWDSLSVDLLLLLLHGPQDVYWIKQLEVWSA